MHSYNIQYIHICIPTIYTHTSLHWASKIYTYAFLQYTVYIYIYAFLQYTVYTYMHSYNIQYIHICIPTIYKYTVYTHTIYSIYNTYLHSIYIYFSSDIGPQNDILEYISIVTMV